LSSTSGCRPEIELGPSDWFKYLHILELPPDFLRSADHAALHALVARIYCEKRRDGDGIRSRR
jgi:hypothetical protein